MQLRGGSRYEAAQTKTRQIHHCARRKRPLCSPRQKGKNGRNKGRKLQGSNKKSRERARRSDYRHPRLLALANDGRLPQCRRKRLLRKNDVGHSRRGKSDGPRRPQERKAPANRPPENFQPALHLRPRCSIAQTQYLRQHNGLQRAVEQGCIARPHLAGKVGDSRRKAQGIRLQGHAPV